MDGQYFLHYSDPFNDIFLKKSFFDVSKLLFELENYMRMHVVFFLIKTSNHVREFFCPKNPIFHDHKFFGENLEFFSSFFLFFFVFWNCLEKWCWSQTLIFFLIVLSSVASCFQKYLGQNFTSKRTTSKLLWDNSC